MAAVLERTALGFILPLIGLFLPDREGLCKTVEEAKLLGRELARFLAAKAYDGDLDHKMYSPSLLVDRAWHLLILDTKRYRELCKSLLSDDKGFIDHDPFGGDDGEERERRNSAMLSRYKELFGALFADGDG